VTEQEARQRLQRCLLDLLPANGSMVGNGSLLAQWTRAAMALGLTVTPEDFISLREDLVARGLVVKGKGRGGSTGRAAAAAAGSDSFALQGEAPTPVDAANAAARPKANTATAPKTQKLRAADADEPAQVLSYRHNDRRKNNPEVGLVSEASDPQQPKQTWAYNPHLDPVLNFDSARAELEALIDEALASGNAKAAVAALEEIKRRGAPYLQWAGKAERTSFEVDTVSLHVHERIDPMSILSAVRKRLEEASNTQGKAATKAKAEEPSPLGRQASLFEAPFENLPLRSAVDFYRHDKGWANRLIAGDSLLVKEGLAGQVQMIYIDPPYGIKYGSNFQPFVGKRDVKDRSDADLTQEPEMIKAFRDTWELGIHSYLSYLRDRLLLGRELLAQSGGVFVQIGDENVHLVRAVLDEVFGRENFVAEIVAVKTSSATSDYLAGVADIVLLYAKDKTGLKYRALFTDKELGAEGTSQYVWARDRDTGKCSRMGPAEREAAARGDMSIEVYAADNLTSQRPPGDFPVLHQGREFRPGKGYWKSHESGFRRLGLAGRFEPIGNSLMYRRMLSDFAVSPINNIWRDVLMTGFSEDKVYVVQTGQKTIERCLLMSTDPGDLVLDPTCGSGTTAFVAEKWGRRWITCDTSRVAVTLAKQRLMTASYDYYELAYPHEGLKGGFIYKTVPRAAHRVPGGAQGLRPACRQVHGESGVPGVPAHTAGRTNHRSHPCGARRRAATQPRPAKGQAGVCRVHRRLAQGPGRDHRLLGAAGRGGPQGIRGARQDGAEVSGGQDHRRRLWCLASAPGAGTGLLLPAALHRLDGATRDPPAPAGSGRAGRRVHLGDPVAPRRGGAPSAADRGEPLRALPQPTAAPRGRGCADARGRGGVLLPSLGHRDRPGAAEAQSLRRHRELAAQLLWRRDGRYCRAHPGRDEPQEGASSRAAGRMKAVIDTNVLLVANGDHADVSEDCVNECVRRLQAMQAGGTAVIDDGFRIVGEYLHKNRPNVQKGAGNVFLKWLLQNTANAKRVETVPLTELAPDRFAEFPDPALEPQFDAPDRKFAVVAHAHPGKPPVWQAADSKWLDWWPALAAQGVRVDFLCPDDACRFYANKFPNKPAPSLPPP